MEGVVAKTQKEQEQELKEEIAKAIKALETPSDKFRVVALSHYYEQKKVLDLELEKKIKELTIEYDKKSQPLYVKQNEIISGRAITAEELSQAKEYLSEEDLAKQSTLLADTTPIKEFWLKALLNCDILQSEIKEKDEEALKHVTSITYAPEENSNNFTVTFHFEKNDFFTNDTLTKKFFINEDDEVEKTEGTTIAWKEGKNLTVKTIKKTQKNKKTNAKRTVTKEVPDESFFNFFKDGEDAETGSKGSKDEDDEFGGAEEKIQIDQDIGRTLVEEVIPYAIEYFLGVKQGEDDEDGYDDIEEEDEEDCHSDDDHDHDHDHDHKKGKKGADKKKKKSSCDSGHDHDHHGHDHHGHSHGKKGGDKGADKGGDKAGEKPECK